MSEITLSELSEKWGCSRTKICEMIRAGKVRGAHKALVSGKMAWLFPSDITYEETGWDDFIKLNYQRGQMKGRTSVRAFDTVEPYIMRNECTLSIREIAKNLGIKASTVRQTYDRLFEKNIKGGNTIEQ